MKLLKVPTKDFNNFSCALRFVLLIEHAGLPYFASSLDGERCPLDRGNLTVSERVSVLVYSLARPHRAAFVFLIWRESFVWLRSPKFTESLVEERRAQT